MVMTIDYLQWLDLQPKGSVLYVSMGSFLSVSAAQMDEIVAGVQDSGVRYLWVSRGDSSRFEHSCGDQGLVIPWCDQLRVLCHSSVGGFWTHCGWNSTLEAVYAGVPTLTFPILWDQIPNKLVRRFMDFKSNEQTEIREMARKFRETFRIAIAKGGSSDANVDAFIKDISERHAH
ncbi:hypothetical protein V6N13_011000 [Hibiscus sabdariffa]|uniref:Uncharacterized protein n=1 Tax=Hibiscus sabdariffa TaxID=183260 RepID=A0ABR2SB09_9ROSI